jgi:hypothetical protein
MHVVTEMSYHGADPPGAPIFDGCIGRRPGREAASLGMSSREIAALAEEVWCHDRRCRIMRLGADTRGVIQ